MKIKNNLKLHDLAGEKILFLQGSAGKELSKVMSFNETSVFLWENLLDKDFTVGDVASLLAENYETSPEKAAEDAAAWVEKLKNHGILE